MMKKLAVTLAAGLLLAGCASASTTDTEPEQASNPNTDACANFESAFVGGIQAAQDDLDTWAPMREEIDTIALTADGDVKSRMLAFVDDWPSVLDLFVSYEVDDTNTHLAGIERACAASGHTIEVQLIAVEK